MTPHPLFYKIVNYVHIEGNAKLIQTPQEIYLFLLNNGATEQDAHTLMWEKNNVWYLTNPIQLRSVVKQYAYPVVYI